jgi:ribosomal protein L37AE/L43A
MIEFKPNPNFRLDKEAALKAIEEQGKKYFSEHGCQRCQSKNLDFSIKGHYKCNDCGFETIISKTDLFNNLDNFENELKNTFK